MTSFDLGILALFHPLDCFDIIKRERMQKRRLTNFVLILLTIFANYISIFVTHYPVSDKKTMEANIFLEAAMVAVPLLTWVVSSYAISSIMNGESKFSERLTSSCYCLIPYFVFIPVINIVSNLLGAEEAGIYNGIKLMILAWCLMLLLISFHRLNDYSFFKTIWVSLLSILMMFVIWAVTLLAFSLTVQLIYTLRNLFNEINLKYFL